MQFKIELIELIAKLRVHRSLSTRLTIDYATILIKSVLSIILWVTYGEIAGRISGGVIHNVTSLF